MEEEQIRKIIHEEIIKYHLYMVRANLVNNINQVQTEFKIALASKNLDLTSRIERDLKSFKESLASVDKEIERVGKFDTSYE